ncbi:MAG: hypothetical protein Q3987_04480, partial [Oscillospiraceae bacterium]|nr:hypothetical protein [Oscillospiraceae bacterium]
AAQVPAVPAAPEVPAAPVAPAAPVQAAPAPAAAPVAAPAKKKFPIVPVIIGGVALMVAAGVAIFFIATTPSRKY